jgi:hypothetical protein
MDHTFAPIALFAYRRPSHTKRVLDALARCPEFRESALHIYCDGPRDPHTARAVEEVRAVAQAFDHSHKVIRCAEHNQGLANSIVSGVTELCESFGRVIVVEDDVLVSPAFLTYMNRALDAYSDNARVMTVNGYVYGRLPLNGDSRASFIPFTHPWGWATWHRAWRRYDASAAHWHQLRTDRELAQRFNLDDAETFTTMLFDQMEGRLDSWWIRWYYTTFRNEGLGLFPPRSLVRSIGLDETATHGRLAALLLDRQADTLPHAAPSLPVAVRCDEVAFGAFRTNMRPRTRRLVRALGRLRRAMAGR